MPKLLAFLALISAFLLPVFAIPAPQTKRVSPVTHSKPAKVSAALETHQSGGEDYMVIFNTSAPEFAHVADVLSRVGLHADHDDVHTIYNTSVMRGFCASMKSHCITALNAMPDVAIVEKAGMVRIADEQTRPGAPWGLQRISSNNTVNGDPAGLSFTYAFDTSSKLGAGVDIYNIDTGINTQHIAFGGRAKMIYPNANSIDDNGHGTHTAGTAAAMVFGVASAANLFGVKTLDAEGSGPINATLAGIESAIKSHQQRSRQPGFVGSVMSMSLSFQVSTNYQTQPVSSSSMVMTAAIEAAISAGIHVAVAAGNDGKDACNYAPGENGGTKGPAVTVGSISMENTVSTFSNSGECVDVYAPGEQITSTWNGGNNIINIESGTSQATPHVAGIMATLIAKDASLAKSPSALKAYLQKTGLRNVIAGVVYKGDKVILVNNGITAQ